MTLTEFSDALKAAVPASYQSAPRRASVPA